MDTHEKKVKMARKMLTRDERKRHIPLFDSAAWNARKQAIAERLYPKKVAVVPTPMTGPTTGTATAKEGWVKKMWRLIREKFHALFH